MTPFSFQMSGIYSLDEKNAGLLTAMGLIVPEAMSLVQLHELLAQAELVWASDPDFVFAHLTREVLDNIKSRLPSSVLM